jgi:hypothetical protein
LPVRVHRFQFPSGSIRPAAGIDMSLPVINGAVLGE